MFFWKFKLSITVGAFWFYLLLPKISSHWFAPTFKIILGHTFVINNMDLLSQNQPALIWFPEVAVEDVSSNKQYNIICMVFKSFRTNKMKIILVNYLVRCILDYCSVVWRSHFATHTLRLERIQKRFIWRFTYNCNNIKRIQQIHIKKSIYTWNYFFV